MHLQRMSCRKLYAAAVLVFLRSGSSVNLERAMAANGRFGGHIVSGHIDGTERLPAKYRKEMLRLSPFPLLRICCRYIVEKGSIAIDGISLTVASVTKSSFSCQFDSHGCLYDTAF